MKFYTNHQTHIAFCDWYARGQGHIDKFLYNSVFIHISLTFDLHVVMKCCVIILTGFADTNSVNFLDFV